MPARSKAQERYLYATKGAAWVKAHGFDTPQAGLPEHVKAKPKRKTRKKRR